MVKRSFVAAAALLISSVATPIAQATPLQLAQAMQQPSAGGATAPQNSRGGNAPERAMPGGNMSPKPQAPEAGREREGGRERGEMRERGGERSQVRMGVERERGEMRRGGRDRVGVYVRGERREWRHRRHGVRVYVGGPRCRTIIVKKRYHHRVVIKKIRRCR